MSDAIIGALIGLIGLLLGSTGNEYFRRRSRIEAYSKEIFLKRLEVYEVLYRQLDVAAKLAGDFERYQAVDSVNLGELISRTHALVLETARFADEKGLYINDEIFMQCMLTLMSLPSEGTEAELQEFKNEGGKRFWGDSKATKSMIKEETGLGELERLFRRITRAKHDSEYLEYYREKKRQYGIK